MILISVPIEVGATFVGKHLARKVASLTGVNGYEEPEPLRSWSEFFRIIFADEQTIIERPSYGHSFG